MKSLKIVLLGQLSSKANSRVFTYMRGKPMLIKNAKVQKAIDDFIIQLMALTKGHEVFTGPIKLKGYVYYQSRRSDLDISLLKDFIQEKIDKKSGIVLWKGIYKNDRQVVHEDIIRRIDPTNPRIEIEIIELDEEP